MLEKYYLTQSYIDKGYDVYINKIKLKMWKELETTRFNDMLKSKEYIPHITTKQLNDAVENVLFNIRERN